MPQYYVAECQQRGKWWWRLLTADDLDEAVRESASLAGLDEDFRDAQGEEWDILIPEKTLLHEFPDCEVCDRWWKLLTTRRKPMNTRTPKEKPPVGTEGIFYLVPYPQGWRILPVRSDEFPNPDFGHPDYWEGIVAEALAKKWHSRVSKEFPTPDDLHTELLPLVYAFPRGRITLQDRKFIVYHGGNFAPFMKCERKAIEGLFDIQGRSVWQFDEHEQCQMLDKERARELLHLPTDWKAI